jgi:hypothetical protein
MIVCNTREADMLKFVEGFLFKKYPTMESLALANPSEVEEIEEQNA